MIVGCLSWVRKMAHGGSIKPEKYVGCCRTEFTHPFIQKYFSSNEEVAGRVPSTVGSTEVSDESHFTRTKATRQWLFPLGCCVAPHASIPLLYNGVPPLGKRRRGYY